MPTERPSAGIVPVSVANRCPSCTREKMNLRDTVHHGLLIYKTFGEYEMKLRLIEKPDGWIHLEQRKLFRWAFVSSFFSSSYETISAWEKARNHARILLNPIVENMK